MKKNTNRRSERADAGSKTIRAGDGGSLASYGNGYVNHQKRKTGAGSITLPAPIFMEIDNL